MPRTRSDRSWVPRIDWTKLNPIRATRMEGCLRLNVPCQGSRRNNAVPGSAEAYASSSCAYRSINFLVPRPGKLTETRLSSSSPSTPTTVPVPYVGCRTFRPSIGLESAPRFNGGRVNEPGLLCRRCADDTGFIPLRTRCKNSSDEYEY